MTEIKGNSVDTLKYYVPFLLLPAVNVVQTVLLKEDMALVGDTKKLLFMFLWVCVEEVVFRKAVPIFLFIRFSCCTALCLSDPPAEHALSFGSRCGSFRRWSSTETSVGYGAAT